MRTGLPSLKSIVWMNPSTRARTSISVDPLVWPIASTKMGTSFWRTVATLTSGGGGAAASFLLQAVASAAAAPRATIVILVTGVFPPHPFSEARLGASVSFSMLDSKG